MIAILENGRCFINNDENDVKKLLIDYVKYFGCCDVEEFKILALKTNMTTEKLIDYINTRTTDFEGIVRIYKLSEKVY